MNQDRNVFEKLVAPDVSLRKEIYTKINDSAYYVIVILISLLSVFIPPLFMGCLYSDIGMAFPKNLEGWILWGILNGAISVANISILVLFKLQAKKGCKKDPSFIRGNKILNELSGQREVFIPRSPAKMNTQDYLFKVCAILVTTLASSIMLTSLLLSFDWLTLLSCLVSIIITLCLSWVTMLNNEAYWTEEYELYALMLQEKYKHKIKQELHTDVENGEKAC